MYSENSKKGFSILRMIFVCLLIALFVFIVMWLVAKAKKSSCDEVNNSNSVFNNNMSYLQQVGTDYFTEDKLPKEVGQTVKISLAELIEKKYALTITDKNGKTCNQEDSYVIVTKTEKGYEMKTFLACGSDSNYTVKELTFCNCEDKCTCKPIVENQFMKKTTKTVTSYTCPSGYTKNGSKCTLTKVVDTKNPTVKTNTITDTKNANKVVISGTKTLVNTIVTNKKEITTPTTTVVTSESKTIVYDDVIKDTKTTRVYADAKKTNSETCKEATETKPDCNIKCKTVITDGSPRVTCNSCTITYTKCTTTDTWYCPGTYTSKGSGSNTTCYKDVPETTYSCPKTSTNHSGSGETLKCWHYKTIPAVTKTTCPNGYKLENNSCVKTVKVYSCPSTSNYSEGKDENLKCYTVKSGKYIYNCNGYEGYTLSGTSCVKTTTTKENVCPTGYKLENGKCNKYSTTTKKATSKKTTKTEIKYKWSVEETLAGWTKTGKTREVENKACNK